MDHGDEQYELNFSGNERIISSAASIELGLVLARITGKYNEAGRAYEQALKENGIPVFQVRTQNDRDSVEADFGAPLHGLEFFPSLLNFDKARRYEPIHTVDDFMHTHFDEKMSVAKSFKNAGYNVLFDWSDEESVASQIHFSNGGVTKTFGDVAKVLIGEFERINKIAKNYGRTQKAAFIVPVPTYGLFLDRLEHLTENTDVEIVHVRRRDNGAVDRNSLKAQLQLCQEEGLRVIGYYDCNPNNPTGYIRDEEDTEKTGVILESFSQRQTDQDEEFLIELRKDGADTKATSLLSNYYMDTVLGRPVIIDDMAYEGLELDRSKAPFSFGQCDFYIAEQTVVLKGISKLGLPGVRIGMAIADPVIVESIIEEQLFSDFTANSFGVDILTARYGDHAKKYLFDQHQDLLRDTHQERFTFAKAFFNGLNNVEELGPKSRKKLISEYAAFKDISPKQAEAIIQKGLPNFRIPDKLESGFFLPVYFDSLHGREIALKYDNRHWPDHVSVESSYALYWLLKGFHVSAVVAVQQGASERSLSARMTLSMGRNDFYRFFDAMRNMHDFFFGEKPQVQKDLFRDYAPRM